MVSINPVPVISVAATGQDADFETFESAFQQAILWVSHEEKIIEDI